MLYKSEVVCTPSISVGSNFFPTSYIPAHSIRYTKKTTPSVYSMLNVSPIANRMLLVIERATYYTIASKIQVDTGGDIWWLCVLKFD